MPVDVRARACGYLRGGNVTVLLAHYDQVDPTRAYKVRAHVVGHTSTYVVHLANGVWSCTCGSPADCPHAAAVQLVTGHPSLARKAEK